MKKIFLVLCLLTFSFSLFAQSSPVPDGFKKGEIPQWAKDLRRTEIITLGSIPFVTIWTTLAYSIIVKGAAVNPLGTDSSDSLSLEDQGAILGIACGISLFLGITDFTINLIQRLSEEKKVRIEEEKRLVNIIPLNGVEKLVEDEISKPDYLSGGLDSVIY